MSKPRLAILISGRGSNMLAVADAVKQNKIAADICLVLSNKEDAPGIAEAAKRGLPTQILERGAGINKGGNRDEYDEQLLNAVDKAQPDLVLLAGFMYIIGEKLVETYYGRMINIHPSLLPKYPGLNTHKRALANSDKLHGLTIHYVTNDLDAGPIIMQKSIEVMAGDNEDSLAARLLSYEHSCLVDTMALIVQQRIKLVTDADGKAEVLIETKIDD